MSNSVQKQADTKAMSNQNNPICKAGGEKFANIHQLAEYVDHLGRRK